jgi:D-threo-aldose 1-dehydrogenase
MNPLATRIIGKSDLSVTALGLGGTSHGNMYKALSEEKALEVIAYAYDFGIRYFDVAPLYGYGRSERLFGQYLKTVPRNSFVLSTKVGRLIGKRSPGETVDKGRNAEVFVDCQNYYAKFDFSRDGILRSIEESLNRLQLDDIDIIHIHDPDYENCYEQALNETFPTLAELRDKKVIGAIGAGMNQAEMLTDFAKNADFDCFLLAGRYTLLDQIALKELLPLCAKKNIGIIIGGAYNSGILATGAVEGARYNYKPAPIEIMEKTRRIETVCNHHKVPMKAAALQFPFGHPAVVTNIPGTGSIERFKENIEMMQYPIPLDFWAELKHEKLISENTPIPK